MYRIFLMFFLAFIISCNSSSDIQSKSLTGPNPNDSLADTVIFVSKDNSKLQGSIKIATLNMYIGFDVQPLLFKNMNDSDIAFGITNELANTYKASNPQFRITECAKKVSELNPDILFLQEALILKLNDSLLNDFLTEFMAELERLQPGQYSSYRGALNDYLVDATSRKKEFISVQFKEGNAFVYKKRLALLDSSNKICETLITVPWRGKLQSSERAMLYGKFKESDGRTYQVYGTHLEVFADYNMRQAAQINKWIDSLKDAGSAQFLIGDFNSDPGEDAHGVFMSEYWADSFSKYTKNDLDGYTWFGGNLSIAERNKIWEERQINRGQRIDYILAKRIVGIDSTGILIQKPDLNWPLLPTDHCLVWAKISTQK